MKKILLYFAAILLLSGNIMAQPMELEFDTNVSPGTTITLPLYGITSVTINWGDGNEETIITSGDIEHTYGAEGVYNVTIDGTFTRFGKKHDTYDNADKLIRLIDFGDVGLTSLAGAFRNAENLTEVPTTLPSTIINTSRTFYSAASFNQDLDTWDVTNITDMSVMFRKAVAFNGNITNWNVENVTTMSSMFAYAESFNQDIGGWDVSNITNMYSLFYYASSFNQNIGGWDVSSVENMGYMFAYCNEFNQDIGGWDVGEVTTMNGMFHGATNFDRDIGGWNVENVTSMSSMLRGLSDFNQDITNWDVSNVEIMSFMFNSTENFNQDIGNWDVSNVKNMKWMFRDAKSFNQDIASWEVDSVEDMSYMFHNAEDFNQDIGDWDMSNVSNVSEMLTGTSLSTAFYNNLLIGWSSQTLQDGLTFHGGNNNKYSPGEAADARQDIIDNYNWTISDGGLSLLPAVITDEITEIDASSAISGGEVSSDGGYSTTEIGVVWNTTENPSLTDNEGYTEDEYIEATTKFMSELSALSPNTLYYVRAYATNSQGTEYGNSMSFTTAKHEVTISGDFTVSNKEYDGTTGAIIENNNLTLEGVIGGDDVELINVVAEFASPEVSQDVQVTIVSAGIEGADAGNYELSLTGAPTATADITAKELSISGDFTVSDKEYDGTTDAAIDNNSLTPDGVIGDDDIELVDIIAEFASPEVSQDVQVTIVSAGIEGADAGNYELSLTGAPTATADITAKELSISGDFTVSDKEYDGTTDAAIDNNSLTPDGVIGDDDIELVDIIAEFASPEVSQDVQVTIVSAGIEGADAGNYELSLTDAPTTTADITEPVNINEIILENINIYPNPFNNHIYIDYSGNTSKIVVTNILGKNVLLKKCINNTIKLDASYLGSGIYLLTIEFDNGTGLTRKIIKH
jgi:surface protein